jgi:hypothetical protein
VSLTQCRPSSVTTTRPKPYYTFRTRSHHFHYFHSFLTPAHFTTIFLRVFTHLNLDIRIRQISPISSPAPISDPVYTKTACFSDFQLRDKHFCPTARVLQPFPTVNTHCRPFDHSQISHAFSNPTTHFSLIFFPIFHHFLSFFTIPSFP